MPIKATPSNAHIWMECPGMVNMSKGLPSTPPSPSALEGIRAHEIAAECLNTGVDAWQLADNGEQASIIQVYLQAVRSAPEGFERVGVMEVEKDITLNTDPHFPGRVDCIGYFREEQLELLRVDDFKYGAAFDIEADCPQLLCSAVLALRHRYLRGLSSPDEVMLRVIQPKLKDNPIKTALIDLDKLIGWRSLVFQPALEATANPKAPLVPGSHCAFCPANPVCPEVQKSFAKALEPQPLDISPEEVGERLALIKTLISMKGTLEKKAFSFMMAGQKVKGFKLVHALSDRIWRDLITARQKLVDKYGKACFTEPSLLSPARIELLPESKEIVAELVHRVDKGLTLVPESDRRAGVSRDTKSQFESIK